MVIEPRIIFRCNCGSDNVTRDAYCTWDAKTQEWVLCDTYDSMSCSDCGYDGNYWNEIEIDENDDPIPDDDDDSFSDLDDDKTEDDEE